MDTTMTAVLAMLAALWGAATVCFHVTKELNLMRDAVLSGHQGIVRIDLAHRRLLLESDWRPLRMILVFLNAGFGSIAIFVAVAACGTPNCYLVILSSAVTTIYSFGSAFIWVRYGGLDIALMERVLAAKEAKAVTKATSRPARASRRRAPTS